MRIIKQLKEKYCRFCNCLSIIRHKSEYVNQATYYPEAERKGEKEILKDYLWFVRKYGEIEPFYFTYGFDRVEMTRERIAEEYIVPYHQFERRINYLNLQNPRYDDFQGKITGRVITLEKFYFNIFLEKFGIPTPKVLCFIKDKKPLYFNERYHVNSTLSAIDQLKSFFSNDMDAFCKPTAGQLGNGAFPLNISMGGGKIMINNELRDFDYLMDIILSDDYLIQERITQHEKMSVLCPSTINSIRLQTVMDKNGIVHPFGAGLRIGRVGGSVDNWAKGGIFVGIDMEKGALMKKGFLKPEYGTSTDKHLDTKIKFEGFEIPYFKDAVVAAVKLHSYLYRCHSVGWDIAISPTGPCFIEGNGLWEISMPQTIHGGLKKEIEKYF
jgi:hypothetical protein